MVQALNTSRPQMVRFKVEEKVESRYILIICICLLSLASLVKVKRLKVDI